MEDDEGERPSTANSDVADNNTETESVESHLQGSTSRSDDLTSPSPPTLPLSCEKAIDTMLKVNGDLHDEENASSDDSCNESLEPEKKRKRSIDDLEDFLGFKKKCIDSAAECYQKVLKYAFQDVCTSISKDEAYEDSNEQQNCDFTKNSSDIRTSCASVLSFNDSDAQCCSSNEKNQEKCVNDELSLVQNLNSTKSEYAQYLGLQPTVKFKCIKCSTSNFPTLTALNKHLEICSDQHHKVAEPVAPTPPSTSTNFKITRRVYLCSACGVYFEIWKLFLHMRTAHRRYICLICLGLFSIAERLSNHLVVKHDIVAKNYDNIAHFFQDYVGQIFVMCCECEKMFTEKDNFADHICEPTSKEPAKAMNSVNSASSNLNTSNKSSVNNSESSNNSSSANHKSKSSKHMKNANSTAKLSTVPKGLSLKSSSKLKNKILPSEHVTGDTHVAPPSDHNSTQDKVDKIDSVTSESELKSEQESSDKVSVNERSETPVNRDTVIEENENDTNEVSPNQINTHDKDDPNDKLVSDESNSSTLDREEIYHNPAIDDASSPAPQPEKSDIAETCEINKELQGNESNVNSKEEMGEEAIKKLINDEPSINLNNTGVPTSSDKLFNDADCDESTQLEAVVSGDHMSDSSDRSDEVMSSPPMQDRRRVPKVTLKIPPNAKTIAPVDSDSDSDDSCKLTMEVDDNGSNNEENGVMLTSEDINMKVSPRMEKSVNGDEQMDISNPEREAVADPFPVAGAEVPVIDLGLRPPLDKVTIQSLLKDFIRSTCYSCVYCNYARKIAVNGKQLGLHMIAEHRFSATADSITAEELLPETFVARIRDCLDDLQPMYFNLESYDNADADSMTPYDRTYECFQCRFVTTVHKELYLHNRKMHQKTLLLCIMCKSTFYSYSELLCHMCPGVYNDSEVHFRCCLCPQDGIPSAFRLMVHLRKRHHACDVCLETCNNQSKLSNHVWKHKLHHLCYRCGIAYRNKPDITKHLFWKHGTESVLCKKCLQKKWPHVYHFCIPPITFVCEECNRNFTKAVALKVHKRFHSNIKPYSCNEENCTEKFVSKKLLEKHITAHREPPPSECINPPTLENEPDLPESQQLRTDSVSKVDSQDVTAANKLEESISKENLDEPKIKTVLDVYDLPALNLSESDSDSEDDTTSKQDMCNKTGENQNLTSQTDSTELDEHKPVPIVDGIWDNFKNYQAAVEKREQLSTDLSNPNPADVESIGGVCDKDIVSAALAVKVDNPTAINDLADAATSCEIKDPGLIDVLLNVIMTDHDYCVNAVSENTTVKDEEDKVDHDYCTDAKIENDTVKVANGNQNAKPNKGNSDSSSDSSSSSCTCGSNCSCTSSSSGSSSSSSSSSDSDSSTSEGRRRNEARRLKRKERARNKKKISETSTIDVVVTEDPPVPVRPPPIEIPIYESDLYTDESETDEDFYDESPQLLAKKLIEEKKNQLILDVGGPPSMNGSFLETSRSSTPIISETQIPKKKLKVKSKKRKKNQKSRPPIQKVDALSIKLNIPNPYYSHQPSHTSPFAASRSPSLNVLPPRISTPVSVPSQSISSPILPLMPPVVNTTPYNSNAGSGSETDSALRLSKRRRVPNRFYGYSSDDESGMVKPPEPPNLQWNKEDLPSPPRVPAFEPPTPAQPVWLQLPIPEPPAPPSASSSDSSESDADSDEGRLHIREPENVPHVAPIPPAPDVHPRPAENLYCYCQCPYDEVSEMIACDGKNCAIEWFHFECVGIMVPPKGKWFCPDCRKQSTQRPEYFMA